MENCLFQEALAFANEKHKHQTRKDGTPYIIHPIRVALYLKEHGYDEKHQVAALLHDAIEDTDATVEDIQRFGDEVATAVVLLSKNMAESVPEGYFKGILSNSMAKAIKNADRIDNLRDAHNSGNIEFMIKYYRESKIYFEGRFSEELDSEIAVYEKYLKEHSVI